MSTTIGYLVGQAGEFSGVRVAIPETGLIIGRDPSQVDVVFRHTMVSRRHAQIAPDKKGKLYLIDLESRNGTCVNGRKITAPVPLNVGDKVDFGSDGKVVFVFESATTPSVTGFLNQIFGENVASVDWKVGDTILDTYEVLGVLGQGGFGKVYKVRHKSWNVDLAVKSPLPKLFSDEKAVEDFVREAETWVNLNLHPNIVQCFYVRTIGGIPRIFAEFVPGGSLHHWIEKGQLTQLDKILDVAIQFAWGLHAAHEQGLVHQDVKPLNVLMMSDGTAKVSDFGLARARRVMGENVVTGPGNMVTMAGMFTPAYCSPEQAQHLRLSRKTDMWSFAVSLLQMFAGKLTWRYGFQAAKALEQYQRFFGPKLAVKMPKRLAKLLAHCFKFKSDDRPKDMLEIANELRDIYGVTCGKSYPRPESRAEEHLADGLNNRAVSLTDLGRQEDAVNVWREALKLDVHHLESTYNIGLVEWRSGRIADAALLDRLRETRKSAPEPWRGSYLTAKVLLERDDCEAAVGVLGDLAESDADHEEISLTLATVRSLLPTSRRCLRTFERHADNVESVCLSADGRLVVSGADSAVRLWEAETGECLRTFLGHSDAVSSVCLNADARLIISGSADSTLRTWEVKTGKCLHTLRGHGDCVTSVSISDDGRFALSGSVDKTVRLWNTGTGQCLQTLAGHESCVWSVWLDPNSRYALSGSDDFTLRLWDVTTGRCLRTFDGHTDAVSSVCATVDGRYALSGSWDGTLRLWDARTGRCLRTLRGHTGEVRSVCLSSDGRFVVSGGKDKTIRLWELATGRCVRTFEGHGDLVWSVALSVDGNCAVSGSSDGTIKSWSVMAAKRSVRAAFELSKPSATGQIASAVARYQQMMQEAHIARRNGDVVQATQCIKQARLQKGCARRLEATNLWCELYQVMPRTRLAGGWQVVAVKERPAASILLDERYALASSPRSFEALELWDITAGECVLTIKDSGVSSVSASSDARFAVSAGYFGNLKVWDLTSGKCIRTFEGHTKGVRSVQISRDSRFVLCASRGKTLKLWESSTGRCLRAFVGHTAEVLSACLSADGRHALSASIDETLKLWDVATGRCMLTLTGHTMPVISACLSADDRYALSGSSDNTLRLWDLSSGECLREMQGHTDMVRAVWLSKNSRFAFSASGDRTVKVWDAQTGECQRTFEGHTDSVTSVHTSGDDRYVLSGSSDGTLRLWHLDWELEARQPADWDERGRSHLEMFLASQTPCAAELPTDRQPTEEELACALARCGKAKWNEDDFKRLLWTLGCAGYGWLRPEGVRRQLEKMAAEWENRPS
ncbi:MAG: protein kinase [Verrucomicrobia bacterium]|nr:protein kinase [Verrucomicrobiota bacterium]